MQAAPAAKAVTVTPDMARKILERQAAMVATNDAKRNRYVKPDVVKQYARDMAAGAWQFNGEAIIIGTDGRLLDGQHRLRACVMAGKPFRTIVTENVADDAFRTIDTGSMRTGGDVLTIGGFSGGTALANAAAIVWRWARWEASKDADTPFPWSDRPTRSELFDTALLHPRLEECVLRARRSGATDLMSPGLAGAVMYFFSKKDQVMAEAFFDALGSGTGMQPDDPIYHLRERLMKWRAMRPRPEQADYMDVVLRAWNHTRKGSKLTKIQRGKTARNDDGKTMATPSAMYKVL